MTCPKRRGFGLGCMFCRQNLLFFITFISQYQSNNHDSQSRPLITSCLPPLPLPPIAMSSMPRSYYTRFSLSSMALTPSVPIPSIFLAETMIALLATSPHHRPYHRRESGLLHHGSGRNNRCVLPSGSATILRRHQYAPSSLLPRRSLHLSPTLLLQELLPHLS